MIATTQNMPHDPSLAQVPTAGTPDPSVEEMRKAVYAYWKSPAAIAVNNFIHKSLSNFSCNTCVGCCHGCLFCSVPSTTTNKLINILRQHGITDADAQWGDYVFYRPWDRLAFLRSLKTAEEMPLENLKKDGNRAVILCSTTDPYQISRHPELKLRKMQTAYHLFLTEQILEHIRDLSSLNVRILTRSPMCKEHFALYKSLGNRLLLGMSIPTLNNNLAKMYEPQAPSPAQRLKTLKQAKAAGVNVFVALAPTYAECDETDIRATLTAIAELDPVTIFHEPINIRAENVNRIAEHAKSLGVTMKTEVFATRAAWRRYAIESLMTVQKVAAEVGVLERLHLWPDPDLDSKNNFLDLRKELWHQRDPDTEPSKEEREARKQLDLAAYEALHGWIHGWWSRISEWPGKAPQPDWQVPPLPQKLFEPELPSV